MTKLIRPEDSSSSPTISIAYQDFSFPFTTTINQKIDNSRYYSVQRFYDGMGRQTRIISGGSIVDTIYPVRNAEKITGPMVTKQSVPYTGSSPDLFTTREIRIQSVSFHAKPGFCRDISCTNMTLGTQAYEVNRPAYTTYDAPTPGIGKAPSQSIFTVSITPSGYPGNQMNTWSATYNITLVVEMHDFNTNEYYPALIYKIP